MRTPKLGPFQRVACLAGQHLRDRRRVQSVVLQGRQLYAAPCAGCGAMMAKDMGGWRMITVSEIGEIDAARRHRVDERV